MVFNDAEYRKKRYANDPEFKRKRDEASRRWLERNPDWRKQYYAKNGDKIRTKVRAYRKANPEKVRAADNAKNRRIREQAYDRYGRQCACCGELRREFLTIDHMTEDRGRRLRWKGQEFYFARGPTELYRLKRLGWPPIVRILCMNCNFACRYEQICPHERERQQNELKAG